MLETKRRNTVGKTFIAVASVSLAFCVVDVFAERTFSGTGLHPVLEWACGLGNNVVEARRSIEQGSLEPPRLFGLPYFSQFRGGEQNETTSVAIENVTDDESTAIVSAKANLTILTTEMEEVDSW